MFAFLRPYLRRSVKKYVTLNEIGISKRAILSNFDTYSRLLPGVSVFPVLKSNAYGHGIREIATILRERPIEYVVADSYHEALEIRKYLDTRVLIIGYTLPENFELMDFRFMTLTVSDIPSLAALGDLRTPVRIHLKIDTGMGRQGLPEGLLLDWIAALKQYPNIALEGVCTHFADADDADTAFMEEQIRAFRKCLYTLQAAGFDPRYVHLSNSAGSAKIAALAPDLSTSVRIGIGLYGYSPLEKNDPYADRLAPLVPALELRSTLVAKKILKKGESVSYGRTFVAKRDMEIGIVPVGYYEGIPRQAGCGKFAYSWNGRTLLILGRVCMNLTIVDLSDAPGISVGDRIVVISRDPHAPNSLDVLARASGTISYESLTRLASTIRRTVEE